VPFVTTVTAAMLSGVLGGAEAVAATPRISAAYGVIGRQLEASPVVTGAPRGAAVVLESRSAAGHARARARRPLTKGRARLRWQVPTVYSSATVRVRVLASGRRRRTHALSPWRTLQVTGAKPAARVAAVTAGQVRSAPAAGVAGPIELTGGIARVGEIIAVGVGPATPYGLLARVIALTPTPSGAIADTVPATLPEVVPTGSFEAVLTSPGGRGLRASSAPLSRSIACEGGATLEAKAQVSIESNVKLTAGWNVISPPHARLEGSTRAITDLAAAVTGQASCTLPATPLFPTPVRLAAVPFTIGPVPFEVITETQVDLSANAAVQGAVSSSLTASLTASAGIAYEHGAFKPIGDFTPDLDWQPPTVAASGSAEVTISPRIDVLVDGILGPRIDLNAGVKLVADIAASPLWRLTAPIDVGAQLRMDFLTAHLASERFVLYSTELPIADANQPTAPPPPLRPPPPSNPDPGSTSDSCGTIAINYLAGPGERYTRMHLQITAGRVSCARARTVMRRYSTDPRPCGRNSGNTCQRRYSDGWLCQAPTAGRFPVIQTCSQTKTIISGTVRPDEASGAE